MVGISTSIVSTVRFDRFGLLEQHDLAALELEF
jgi:hypothetical protein